MMKLFNRYFTVLILISFGIIFSGCQEDDEGGSCTEYAQLVPEVTEAPELESSRLDGRSRIKIKKVPGVRDQDVAAFIKRGVENYDNVDFWQSDVIHLDHFSVISSDDEYWYFDIHFYSSNSQYLVEVYFDCGTAAVQSEHTTIEISSPDICEALNSPAFFPFNLDAEVHENQTLFYFDMYYDGDYYMELVSTVGLIFRTTPTFSGNEGQSHTFTITSSPPFRFPLPMSIDHFSATGFDSAAWPESHEEHGQVIINVDMWICDSWYTAGSIIWAAD